MAAIDVTQKAGVYETLASLNAAFAGIVQHLHSRLGAHLSVAAESEQEIVTPFHTPKFNPPGTHKKHKIDFRTT